MGSWPVVSERSCTTAAAGVNAFLPADTTTACLASGAAPALIVGLFQAAPAPAVGPGMPHVATAPRQSASCLLALRI
jgi:hypothetical protein